MSTRRAVIAVTDLHEGDRIQIGTEFYTLAAKPYLICGGDRWQLETTTCTREYFENSVTIIVPSSRTHTVDEIDALHEYASQIDKLMQFQAKTYNRHARAAFLNGWTEDSAVQLGTYAATYQGVPEVGQFVLIPNKGGGYTRTEVLGVEVNGLASHGFGYSRRVVTRAFGADPWSANRTYMICGTDPAAA